MEKPLNVLFLCSWYPSRVLPTNGDFIQRHAEAVSAQHNVTVFHIITDKKCIQKIEITDVVIQNIRTIIAYIKPTSNRFTKALRFRKAQRILLKKVLKIDVVHVHKLFPMGLFALRIRRKYKIPFIISEHHSIYKHPYYKIIGGLEKRISKIIAKNASVICPVSDDLGNAMQKFGLNGTYIKVPNVVNLDNFKPAKKTAQVFTLLHVSNMATLKNVSGILRVLKKLEAYIPNFHCYFIGGNTDKYKNEAADLQIKKTNVSFINQVPQQDLVSYFQKATAFILFSDTENQPCVIPEAFACGTAVISTDVGGISENFPTDFGILIEPKNEIALLEAILKIHKSKVSDATEMHHYVEENFGEKKICNAFTELYKKALLT